MSTIEIVEGRPVAEHLVATTRGRDRSLVEPERARWLWDRLRAALQLVLACVLMPDHLHLLLGPGQQVVLRRVLTGFSRRFGVRFDLLPPQPANTPTIATRVLRYDIANPVREGLVADPWAWTFSTLRDLGGAAHPVWTEPAQVARVLRVPAARLVQLATDLPDLRVPPLRRGPLLVASAEGLLAGVGAALRSPSGDVLAMPLGRRLVVQAGLAIGSPAVRRLAAELALPERTVRRLRAPPHPGLQAVLTCLGDPRLHDAALPLAQPAPRGRISGVFGA